MEVVTLPMVVSILVCDAICAVLTPTSSQSSAFSSTTTILTANQSVSSNVDSVTVTGSPSSQPTISAVSTSMELTRSPQSTSHTETRSVSLFDDNEYLPGKEAFHRYVHHEEHLF